MSKRHKMLSKPHILSLFPPSRLINSIKHEHSFKISYLTLKAPPIICSRRQLQILLLFQKYQIRHDISWESSASRRFSCNIIPYFCRKMGMMSQNLSSAAVVIGALRVSLLLWRNLTWAEDCGIEIEKIHLAAVLKPESVVTRYFHRWDISWSLLHETTHPTEYHLFSIFF